MCVCVDYENFLEKVVFEIFFIFQYQKNIENVYNCDENFLYKFFIYIGIVG